MSEGLILWLWLFTIFPFKKNWLNFFLAMLFNIHRDPEMPVHEQSGTWGSAESLGYIGMWDE